MTWNIAAECLSIVILCIIWIYSRKGSSVPDVKSRLFQLCFLITFCAMVSNVMSTWLIYNLTASTLIPAWILNTCYFILTPLMGMAYFVYSLSHLYEDARVLRKMVLLFSVPAWIYTVLILINPINKWVFDLSLYYGYRQGPLIMVTYIIFYFYCLICVVMVWVRGKNVASSIRKILISFPLIAGVFIIFQMVVPQVILSGSAATCALLLVYLYLQNKQITVDYLTGLSNRMEFLRLLEAKMKNAEKEDLRFAVLVFSLKEFKQVNDIYGQMNGDAVLAEVGKFLFSYLPYENGKVYRFSGDEFALYMEDVSNEAIVRVIDSMQMRLESPWRGKNCTCMLSMAIGIISFPESAHSVEELINGVEYAVSVAKATQGREKVYFCDSGSLEKVRRRQQIGAIMQECLDKDMFRIHYQPVYDIKNGNFPLAEALLRIEDSPLGRISPGEFIPIAEESGLIIKITYWVFAEVCRCIRRMMDDGISLDGISVNFSSLQFAQSDLAGKLERIAGDCGVPFHKLKIEITESTLAENEERVTDFIQEVSRLGAKVGLDDFGMGFSNLSSVTNLPIDIVKLDRSLVVAAMENRRSAIIVRNLSKSFTELGMTVLAEGVEKEEQSKFVEESGCELIQGFLYARPMDEKAFTNFIREKNFQ